jgi:hypothetical protein
VHIKRADERFREQYAVSGTAVIEVSTPPVMKTAGLTRWEMTFMLTTVVRFHSSVLSDRYYRSWTGFPLGIIFGPGHESTKELKASQDKSVRCKRERESQNEHFRMH